MNQLLSRPFGSFQLVKSQTPIIRQLITLICIFVIANGLFWGAPALANFYYQDKILPGVAVQSVSVGGRSFSEAFQALSQNPVELKRLTSLIFKDEVQSATLSELGAQEDIKAELVEAYQVGRQKPYLANRHIPKKFKLNEEKLKQTVTRLFGELAEQPTNARLVIDQGRVKIEPSKSGHTYNWPAIGGQVLASLDQPDRPITIQTQKIDAPVLSAHLIDWQAKIERLLERPLTMVIDQEAIKIPKEEIGQWLSIKQDSRPVSATINQASIEAYVDRLAKKYNAQAIPEISLEDGTIEQPGAKGRELKKAELVGSFLTALNEDKASLVTQVAFQEVPYRQKTKTRGYTAGLADGKYIEINLAEQTMYVFEGDNLISTYPVSTGKWSMPTPEGEFAINNKIEVAYSKRYNLYMPKWQSFIGSKYGIHGLPYWASGYVEGEDHLGRPVSHGCVRLSHADAASLYDQVEVGTKVYIHK